MHDRPAKVTEPEQDELFYSLNGAQCWEERRFSALAKAGMWFGISIKTQGPLHGTGLCVFGISVPHPSVCCLPVS